MDIWMVRLGNEWVEKRLVHVIFWDMTFSRRLKVMLFCHGYVYALKVKGRINKWMHGRIKNCWIHVHLWDMPFCNRLEFISLLHAIIQQHKFLLDVGIAWPRTIELNTKTCNEEVRMDRQIICMCICML